MCVKILTAQTFTFIVRKIITIDILFNCILLNKKIIKIFYVLKNTIPYISIKTGKKQLNVIQFNISLLVHVISPACKRTVRPHYLYLWTRIELSNAIGFMNRAHRSFEFYSFKVEIWTFCIFSHTMWDIDL